jgi:hypothetical protein
MAVAAAEPVAAVFSATRVGATEKSTGTKVVAITPDPVGYFHVRQHQVGVELGVEPTTYTGQ